MRRPTGRTRFALSTIALVLAAAPAVGCERKRGDRPAPAAKPISPPAVEPLPAPRARGQMASPAATPPEPSPPSTPPRTEATEATETETTEKAPVLDAGR